MRGHSPTRPNQGMQLTAGGSAFPLDMTSIFNLQRRASSPAVAELVSLDGEPRLGFCRLIAAWPS